MKATKEGSATLVSGMPKIDEVIKKFGAHERENPPFVIVGLIKLPSTGWNGGILAFAMTEWSAYSIRNILNPYGNDAVLVRHTEHHPNGETYDVAATSDITDDASVE